MTSPIEWEGRELVLVIGDLHIPHRAEDIPPAFKQLLSNKVSQVICTGNLCMKSTEDFVRSLGYNAHIVKGDLDAGLELPETKIIKIGGEIMIGIIHGHQVVPWGDPAMLAGQARGMGVDVLVHGHSHVASLLRSEGSATSKETAAAAAAAAAANSNAASGGQAAPASANAASGPSTLLLNPGSLTGAYSPFATNIVPSFALLAIQGPHVLIYQYELSPAGEVSVHKSEWKKTK